MSNIKESVRTIVDRVMEANPDVAGIVIVVVDRIGTTLVGKHCAPGINFDASKLMAGVFDEVRSLEHPPGSGGN